MPSKAAIANPPQLSSQQVAPATNELYENSTGSKIRRQLAAKMAEINQYTIGTKHTEELRLDNIASH